MISHFLLEPEETEGSLIIDELFPPTCMIQTTYAIVARKKTVVLTYTRFFMRGMGMKRKAQLMIQ